MLSDVQAMMAPFSYALIQLLKNITADWSIITRTWVTRQIPLPKHLWELSFDSKITNICLLEEDLSDRLRDRMQT